jgi:hypothetical protein
MHCSVYIIKLVCCTEYVSLHIFGVDLFGVDKALDVYEIGLQPTFLPSFNTCSTNVTTYVGHILLRKGINVVVARNNLI